MPSPAAPPNTSSLPLPAPIVSTSPTPGSIVVADTPNVTRPSSPKTVSLPSPTVIPSTPGPPKTRSAPFPARIVSAPTTDGSSVVAELAYVISPSSPKTRSLPSPYGDAVARRAAEHVVVAVAGPDRVHIAHTRIDRRRRHPERNEAVVAEDRVVAVADRDPVHPGPAEDEIRPVPARIVSAPATDGSSVVAETPNVTLPSSPKTVSLPSPTVMPSPAAPPKTYEFPLPVWIVSTSPTPGSAVVSVAVPSVNRPSSPKT